MTRKKRIGVVFGGRSGEHEISVRSARSVIESLNPAKYEVVPIGITKAGKWLAPKNISTRSNVAMRGYAGLYALLGKSTEDVAVVGDPSRRELISMNNSDHAEAGRYLDVIFPVLHGTFGEDGTIQGLLEMAGIPYVGCGVLASSCGMDKVAMKVLFSAAGLPMCKYMWFLRTQWEQDPHALERSIIKKVGFPCFVKPANLGSSVGISKAGNKKSLKHAIELASRYDRKIIVEEGLDMRELECGVIGNDSPSASLPGEYLVHDTSAAFLDYTEKYSGTGHVEFVVPARVSATLTRKIQRLAIKAFQAVDGSGLARVDFFLLRDNKTLLVNELNTLPGLTDVSGFPKMWQSSGLPFPELVERLIDLAIERHADKSRNETSIQAGADNS